MLLSVLGDPDPSRQIEREIMIVGKGARTGNREALFAAHSAVAWDVAATPRSSESSTGALETEERVDRSRKNESAASFVSMMHVLHFLFLGRRNLLLAKECFNPRPSLRNNHCTQRTIKKAEESRPLSLATLRRETKDPRGISGRAMRGPPRGRGAAGCVQLTRSIGDDLPAHC